MALNIGDVIDGKYRIVRLLGEGGMGAVFEGENTRIHRRVAIKVLHAGVASNEDAVARFEREAQAAGRIGSEHIVEVLDLGNLPGGDRYMVMEFLEGESLADRIQSRGRLSPQVTASILVDMLEGLRAAHDAGIIHRDLKPDNVFLLANRGGKKDFVKIVDFGISKFNVLGGNSEFSMTRTGAVMGTPYYMSPEQAKGNRDVDHRADLYAVGVILYECVAGEVPFNAETFNELLFKIVLEQPIPLLDKVPTCDPTFSMIVDKAMARDPATRFQTAGEFQAALGAWLSGQPVVVDTTATYGTPGLDRTNLPARPGSIADAEAPRPKTVGAWASTGGGTSAPAAPKKRTAVVGAVAAVAALAVGVAGFLVLRKNSAEDERLTQAARAAEEADDQRLAAERARLELERAKVEAERAKAEQARAESERLRAEAEERDRKEAAEAAKATAGTASAPRRTTTPPPARSPSTTPAATPAPAPAPAPASPAPTPTSGRRIRTDL